MFIKSFMVLHNIQKSSPRLLVPQRTRFHSHYINLHAINTQLLSAAHQWQYSVQLTAKKTAGPKDS